MENQKLFWDSSEDAELPQFCCLLEAVLHISFWVQNVLEVQCILCWRWIYVSWPTEFLKVCNCRWWASWCVLAPDERGEWWLPDLAMGREHYSHYSQSERRNHKVVTWKIAQTITIFSNREHFSETMDSMPGLAAFDRPCEERNMRGFGFQVEWFFLPLWIIMTHYLGIYPCEQSLHRRVPRGRQWYSHHKSWC